MRVTGNDVVTTCSENAHTNDSEMACACCITAALTRAHADGVREGLERAVQKADQWASSASCQFHDDNPCCHVRTGAGIAAAIRALIPGEGT